MSNNSEQSVRIAFASDDGETISSHFGRARQYVVVRLEQGQIAGRELRDKFSPHAQGENHNQAHQDHDHKHEMMVDPIKDCQLVVARGMGHGARHHLESAGIEILLTEENDIEEAIEAYRRGDLTHDPDRLHLGHGHHD